MTGRRGDLTPPVTTRSVGELLRSGQPSYSFEFFPPKDDEGERSLFDTVRRLEALAPTFVSVTYGAGGSTRDRTVRLTRRIAEETTLVPVAHLTCVSSSVAELRTVVGSYADAGVSNILALRGDPPGGPGGPWEAHPEGLDHARDLVALVRSLGDFSVGVAAFPEGHPSAASLEHDADVLAAKQEAGATFAVTQFFFRVQDYEALVERAAARGVTMPLVPGIMPVTNVAQLERFAQLSGTSVPKVLVERLHAVSDDPAAVRSLGVEIATELCVDLLASGAPGLHFYTLNKSSATREIYHAVAPTRAAIASVPAPV